MSPKATTLEFIARISNRVIYGTILVGAMIGSFSDPLPTNLRIIVYVFLSLQIICVAHAYANMIGEDLVTHRVRPWRESKMVFRPNWMMASTVVPITFFGLASLGLVTQSTALAATKAVLLMSVLFFGYASRRLSGRGVFSSVSEGMLLTLLCYVLIKIKVWTRYLAAIG